MTDKEIEIGKQALAKCGVYRVAKEHLEEGVKEKELLVVEGPALICDGETHTGRIYPKDIVKEALVDYNKKVLEGTALGRATDATAHCLGLFYDNAHFCSITHRISHVYMKQSTLYAQFIILDTDNGKVLRRAFENIGCKFMAIFKGMGNVRRNKKGNFVVQKGLKILSIDLQLIEEGEIEVEEESSLCGDCWWFQFSQESNKVICLELNKDVDADDKAPKECFKQFVF